MSNELTKLESTSLAELKELKGMAQVFFQSGLFADVHDTAQAFVKIIKGRELGFPPVNSMEMIDIIQKRLFLKPRAVGALINSCGYGSYITVERTADRCVIRFSRKTREGWIDLPDVEYTIQIAKDRGLTGKSPEWKTDPANMLFWRCLGRGGAQYFPELLAGLAPTPDFVSESVSDEQFEQNVSDLYGDGPERTMPDLTAVDAKEGQPNPTVHTEVVSDAHDGNPIIRQTWRARIDDFAHDIGNRLHAIASRLRDDEELSDEWREIQAIRAQAIQAREDATFPDGKGDELARALADVVDMLASNAALDGKQGSML